MECKVAINYIHQYLDGELEIDEYKLLQDHMNECAACREQFKELEKVDALMHASLATTHQQASLSEADASRLTSSIMSQIPTKRAPQSKTRFVRWLYRYPGLTAAAVFVVVMFISMLSSWDQETKLVISGSKDDLQHIIIEGNTVIVPEGVQLSGDLIVENGIVEVKGAVSGDVTVIDGKMVLASTGYIAGHSKTIDQALDWIWYKVTSSISVAIPH